MSMRWSWNHFIWCLYFADRSLTEEVAQNNPERLMFSCLSSHRSPDGASHIRDSRQIVTKSTSSKLGNFAGMAFAPVQVPHMTDVCLDEVSSHPPRPAKTMYAGIESRRVWCHLAGILYYANKVWKTRLLEIRFFGSPYP